MQDYPGFKASGEKPPYMAEDESKAQNDTMSEIKTKFNDAMTAYSADPTSAKPALQEIADMQSPVTVSDLAQSMIDDIPEAQPIEQAPENVSPPADLAKFKSVGGLAK